MFIPNKLYYLASPYSKYPGGKEEAYQLVCKKAAELMRNGFRLFCPIAHSHPIEVIGGIPAEEATHEFWLEQDFAVLDRCDTLLVYKMPGWQDSAGVQAEVARATRRLMPVLYLDFDYHTQLTGIVNEWVTSDGPR